MAEFKSEKEIVAYFQALRQKVQETYTKVSELNGEIAEHDVVLKALEPMEPKRKCFRLIGEVLVERNVGEVLPAVRKNRDNLDAAVKSMLESAKQQETELNDFQAKYKIRIVRENEEEDSSPRPAPSQSAGTPGVLVSK